MTAYYGWMTDELEVKIRREIADILRLADVHAGDDFFALGGASLEAIELVDRLQANYGVELSIADIFDAPDIVAIVDAVRAVSVSG
jgi:acyl carrier protein